MDAALRKCTTRVIARKQDTAYALTSPWLHRANLQWNASTNRSEGTSGAAQPPIAACMPADQTLHSDAIECVLRSSRGLLIGAAKCMCCKRFLVCKHMHVRAGHDLVVCERRLQERVGGACSAPFQERPLQFNSCHTPANAGDVRQPRTSPTTAACADALASLYQLDVTPFAGTAKAMGKLDSFCTSQRSSVRSFLRLILAEIVPSSQTRQKLSLSQQFDC